MLHTHVNRMALNYVAQQHVTNETAMEGSLLGANGIEKYRQDFPIFDHYREGRSLVYLDNAATTLKPRSVVDAMSEHYLHGASNVRRGVHYTANWPPPIR